MANINTNANSFEPLVGYTNNSSQMLSMKSRCAVRRYDQSRFKVKVIIQGLTLYDFMSCPPYIFWTVSGIYKSLCTNVKSDESMCSAYVGLRLVQGQGHSSKLNIVWLYFVSALYLLNPFWDLQITLHKCVMRRCAVRMLDKGRFKVNVKV